MGCFRSPRRQVLAASIVATTQASRSFHYHGHRESFAVFECPGRHLERSVRQADSSLPPFPRFQKRQQHCEASLHWIMLPTKSLTGLNISPVAFVIARTDSGMK